MRPPSARTCSTSSTELQTTHQIVGDVRGLGLFMAVELVRDPVRHEVFPAAMHVDDQVAAVARTMGLRPAAYLS